MKNAIKVPLKHLFGNPQPSHKVAKVPLLIIALIALIGLAMTGCNNNGGTSGPLTLSGDISITNTPPVYVDTELTAVYSGLETVSYQWKKNGTNVGTNANKHTATEAGSYTVTVSAAGYDPKTSTAVAVEVDPGPLTLIEMVWIPAGTFQMGSLTSEPGRDTDEIRHQVTLTSGFYMGKYQITQAQYEEVMESNPSSFKTSVAPEANTNNRPVETVSWYDALVFCNKLSLLEELTPAYRIPGFNNSTDPADWGDVPSINDETWNATEIVDASTGYRLPTEAQWEYACRAGTTTAFNWETNYIDDRKANYDARYLDDNNTVAGTYLARTTKVGSYTPNAWGLYDMHGNVWEWCWDWYGTYASGEQTDPVGDSGSMRVIRGGYWFSGGHGVRSAYRGGSSLHIRANRNGLRLIRNSAP